MKELSRQNQEIVRYEFSSEDEAVKIFEEMGESYKVEIISQINQDDTISLYKQSNFTDLCRGPHVSNTSKIRYFKLLSTSGAYWKVMKTIKCFKRIYGTVFSQKVL